MIELLALSNFTLWLTVGVVVFVAAQMVFIARILKGINSDAGTPQSPLPNMHAAESNENNAGGGFRTTVATPRARKLQPAPVSAPERRPADLPAPADLTPEPAPVATAEEPPVKPLIPAPVETELAEPMLASAEVAPGKSDLDKDSVPASEKQAPAGALILSAQPTEAKAAPAAEKPAEKPASIPAPKIDLPVTPALAVSKELPPLTLAGSPDPAPKSAALPSEVPTPARKFFNPAVLPASASNAGTPTTPAEKTPKLFPEKSREEGALPVLSSLLVGSGSEKKSPVDVPDEASGGLALLKTPEAAPVVEASKADVPKTGGADARSQAAGQPIKLAGATGASSATSPGADDVKKNAPQPPTPEPAANSGLILIPPSESKPELPAAEQGEAPAESAAKPTEKPTADKAAEPVLSPAVADAAPAAKAAEPESKPEPEPKPEAKPAKGPRVFLPGKFFGGSKKDKEPAKPTEPALVPSIAPVPEPAKTPAPMEAKSDAPKITTPAAAPSLVVAPVEEVTSTAKPAPTGAPSPDDQPVAKVGETLKDVATTNTEAKAADKPVEAADKKPSLEAEKTPVTAKEEAPVTAPPAAGSENRASSTIPALAPTTAPAPTPAATGLVAISPAKSPVGEKALEEPVAKSAPAPVPPTAPQSAGPASTVPADSKPPLPAAATSAAAPAASTPEKKAEEPVELPTSAAEQKPATEPSTVATTPKPAVESTLPTQAAPTTEPVAEPLAAVLAPANKPEAPVAAPVAPARPEAPVIAAPAPAAPAPVARVETPAPKPAAAPVPNPISSVSKPQPVMPPTDTTTSLPNTGRASAQLTLAFEITSLQLTPFFKLGSVQLKALSNVVSLHLLAAQADNPLAAGISFQIDRVDLDGSSHFKSILLKPLGESRELTAPLPKLQVDNVAVMSGGEGAPISVTTSGEASTAVQLFGTFTIAAMEFTPAFEIGSLRLEPTSNTVLLRVAPSSRPTALDLPPSFEIAQVQLGDGAQITGVRATPSTAK